MNTYAQRSTLAVDIYSSAAKRRCMDRDGNTHPKARAVADHFGSEHAAPASPFPSGQPNLQPFGATPFPICHPQARLELRFLFYLVFIVLAGVAIGEMALRATGR